MNLIFIMMDGARVDRIEKGKNYCDLVNESAFFSKTITFAPYTIAALHAVFSGTYGHKNGVNSYWSSPKFKNDEYKSLSLYLQENGYYTHADVINNLVLPKIGFDKFVVHDEINDNLTERHKELLKTMKSKSLENNNFFLYLHYSNIHTGIMEEVLKKYDNFSTEYFSQKEKNEKFYDNLFDKADNYLGEIISYCKKLELLEDSLIVVISDHGISLGEKIGERAYGVFCYDYTLISTALFHHHSIPKISINKQVRSVDILPTILELLSIPIDKFYEKIDGISLVPLINGEPYDERIAFSQSGNPLNNKQPPKEPNIFSLRTNKWKFINNIYNDSEELYDLENDPKEEKNIIDSNKIVADELRIKLKEILDERTKIE